MTPSVFRLDALYVRTYSLFCSPPTTPLYNWAGMATRPASLSLASRCPGIHPRVAHAPPATPILPDSLPSQLLHVFLYLR
ncbi:hypothetical protein RSOLAG1IB_12298 [Rhizoctonia solani AG-1 IB]|uniref:Uncharacterized protein n=1 Tax=Thanatephorus cucumeris (strain AG1-IB / isolate 7/3/14) TaxID=1108050 RepID=A0A0B7FUY0_THACB|nr:hypothetical protein RSOLAG1IB_12298 [Rhizoctonia solani AG-1 IB]